MFLLRKVSQNQFCWNEFTIYFRYFYSCGIGKTFNYGSYGIFFNCFLDCKQHKDFWNFNPHTCWFYARVLNGFALRLRWNLWYLDIYLRFVIFLSHCVKTVEAKFLCYLFLKTILNVSWAFPNWYNLVSNFFSKNLYFLFRLMP